MNFRYRDRYDAGRAVAEKLKPLLDDSDFVVLALPRGGVPVGYEVAIKMNAPLEVFAVRKLGVPGHEEFAMGAIASGGLWFVNDDVVKRLGISRQQIKTIVEREGAELQRREELYGAEFSKCELQGKTVVLIDDGLATGSTMRAAVAAVKQRHPEKIIVAVPVGSPSTCDDLESEVDRVVCVQKPESFQAVGQWYDDFSQTSDEEVRDLLQRAREQIEAVAANVPPAWPAGF